MTTMTVYAKVMTHDVDRLLEGVEQAVSPFWLSSFATGPLEEWFNDQTFIRFQRQGDARTGKWESLHPPTENIRSQQGYGPSSPINVRTGELLDYLIEEHNLWVVSDGIIFDKPGLTSDPMLQKKLITAQQGSDNNPISSFGPTGPRPVIAFDPTVDTPAILRLLAVWIVDLAVMW